MFRKLISGIVLGMVLTVAAGCSLSGAKAYGPNETVVYDNGDLVITSTLTSDSPREHAVMNTLNTVNGKNVWRVSQECLKYYRGGGTMYISGQLKVIAEANNIAYNKVVGIHYTTNNWKTCMDSDGAWSSHNDSFNSDQFTIYTVSTLPPYCTVKYAIYYKVNGAVYWDNNGGANYSAQF